MKNIGRISEQGVLEIKRAGEFKKVMCREAGILATGVRGGVTSVACDDNCSRFREPMPELDSFVKEGALFNEDVPTGRTIVTLCGEDILIFDEFEDER